MQAGFKLFGEGFVDGALAGDAAQSGKLGGSDSHIEVGFAFGRSAGMSGVSSAIISDFKGFGREGPR